MLRITRVAEPPAAVQLKVEGRLVGESIAVLEQVIADELPAAPAPAPALTLELSDLIFADAAGIAMLRALPAERVAIGGCAAWLRTLLARTGG